MVGMKWKEMFEAMADTESVTYAIAGTLLATEGVRDALEDLGATDDLTPFERYEFGWAFALMEHTPGLVEMLTDTLRTATNARLPIIFKWEERKSICSLATSTVGGKVFITLGTPALDPAKLTRMFAGFPR